MISIVKVIVEYCRKSAGKRGELRYGDILPAPKFSSSCRVLKYLSSRVLLFRLFGRLCSDLFRVSMDPRVKPVGDETLKSSLRADTRGQAIFELDNKETNRKTPGRFLTKTRGDFNGDKIISRDPHVSPLDFLRMTMLKIGRSLDDCLRNRGMTIKKYV